MVLRQRGSGCHDLNGPALHELISSFVLRFLTGKLTQIVFGHRDVVTCLSRSESYIGGDCYVLSGSRDATLLLWYWNGKHNSIGENPGSKYYAQDPSPSTGTSRIWPLDGSLTEAQCSEILQGNISKCGTKPSSGSKRNSSAVDKSTGCNSGGGMTKIWPNVNW